MEAIQRAEGGTVELETVMFLLYVISRAIAEPDFGKSLSGLADRQIRLIEDFAEYVLNQ